MRSATTHLNKESTFLSAIRGAQPDYLDFAYLSFTIGMTFQVSDTDISDPGIRRTVTRHALLGYVFGTVIVGVTINVVAGLIR